MDKLWDALVQNAPSLVGGVLILWLMLKHMDKRDRTMNEVTNSFHAAIANQSKAFRESMHEQAESCHAVQRDSNAVIRDNTAALSKLSTLIEVQQRNHNQHS